MEVGNQIPHLLGFRQNRLRQRAVGMTEGRNLTLLTECLKSSNTRMSYIQGSFVCKLVRYGFNEDCLRLERIATT